jgi:hypothetical protein
MQFHFQAVAVSLRQIRQTRELAPHRRDDAAAEVFVIGRSWVPATEVVPRKIRGTFAQVPKPLRRLQEGEPALNHLARDAPPGRDSAQAGRQPALGLFLTNTVAFPRSQLLHFHVPCRPG